MTRAKSLNTITLSNLNNLANSRTGKIECWASFMSLLFTVISANIMFPTKSTHMKFIKIMKFKVSHIFKFKSVVSGIL